MAAEDLARAERGGLSGRKGKSELQPEPHYNNPRRSTAGDIRCAIEGDSRKQCLHGREGDRGTEFIGGMRAISPPPPRILLSDRSKLYMAGRPLPCKDISIL